MWIALIKQYWQVSLFKETPAETPHSLFVLSLIAILFYALIVFQWSMAPETAQLTFSASLFAGGALLVAYALYTYFILRVFHKANRVIQTLACLLAGHTIVHLVALPLLAATPWLVATDVGDVSTLLISVIYLLFTLVMTVWQFMITVHIYKEALGIAFFPAVLASIGLLASNIVFVSFWR